MRVAMLVTSLLAGTYVVLSRHGRRRTASSGDHAHDDDVTVHTPMIGGDWRSRGPDVDTDIAATKPDIDIGMDQCLF